MQHGDKIKVGYNEELTFDAGIYCVNCGKQGVWEGDDESVYAEDYYGEPHYCPHCFTVFYSMPGYDSADEDKIIGILKRPINEIKRMEFEPPPYVEPPEYIKKFITEHFENMQKSLLVGFPSKDMSKKGCRVTFPNLINRGNNA